MTRRVTISVPDDIADQLDGLPARQVSAYVTDAIRRRHSTDELRAALKAAGHKDHQPDPAAAARWQDAGRVDPTVREAAIVALAKSMWCPVDEMRATIDARSAR